MKIESCNETKYGMTIRVFGNQAQYVDEFLHLNCAPDLLHWKLFPNTKEITESMTARHAVIKHLGMPAFGDPNVMLLDVCSGHTPRTAALFACTSRWQTISVDPVLNTSFQERVERLTCLRQKIEDIEPIKHPGTLVITAVHAHVALDEILKKVRAPDILLVAMPCCQLLDISVPEAKCFEYEDFACWSPERTVKVWRLREDQVLKI